MRVALLLDPLSMVLEDPLSLRVKWGSHAPQIARELLGRGHTVRGFGAPPGLIPRSSEDTRPEDEGTGPRSWRSKLRNFEPDVIVAYDALSPAAWRGARMARKLGATLILVEAGLPVGIARWHERLLIRTGELLWGPYVRRTAAAVVAIDPVARAQALHERFDGGLIRVIRHGVDLTQFRPGLTSTLVSRHRIRGRILLYVGRLTGKRGLETLIAAFSRTVGQRSDWNLVLAGDGGSRPRLRAMVDRLGVADRVHWLPRPRREELPGLMGASTLMAVPARDDKVVGRQIARAMACGLPVLASDLPRLRGLVENDHNGLLVEAGNVESWTKAIRKAAGSPVARKRWSQNGRRLAEETFSWERIAEQFEGIFLEARKRVEVKLKTAQAARETEGA